MENITSDKIENKNSDSAENVTGAEGGISTAEQLLVALEVMAANGGEATMPQLYEAIEGKLDGPKLSEQGKATLRSLINRDAVEKGLVYRHDPNAPGWWITTAGKDLLASAEAQKKFILSQDFKAEGAQNLPEIAEGFGVDVTALANFQKAIQTKLPIVKSILNTYPGWLISNFPNQVQIVTTPNTTRLDVYFYGVWVQSGWFNKTRGFFIHYRDQGLKIYNWLESNLNPKSELGRGNYYDAPTVRFFIKIDKDYERLKELMVTTVKRYEVELASLAQTTAETVNLQTDNRHKALFLTGWWQRLNEIEENSSSSPAILAKDNFMKAGYQAAQDYYSKNRENKEENPAKMAYYKAYIAYRKAGSVGDWLTIIDFTPPKALYNGEAVENLIKAFKVEYSDFKSEKYLKEERTYKDVAAEKARKLLEREILQTLLDQQNYDAIKLRIKQACQGNNLLNQWDYLVIFNALAEPLSHALFDLLYGEEPLEIRFENWVTFLQPTKPRSWPAVTYFLMLFQPSNYLFVKPTPFREFLDIVDSSIVWETRPNFPFYQKLLEMAQQLLKLLEPLGAKDLLDVQSFIWVAKDLENVVDLQGGDDITGGGSSGGDDENKKPSPVDYKEPTFDEIRHRIAENKIYLQDGILRRYHISLKTRGFVILSGLSGSGKTWLAEAYAKAVGGEVCLVSVAPNWTTNEDLLGYFSPLTGKYHDTTVSRFIREAAQAYSNAKEAGVTPVPYFLILDEMNLARVEYYFARFLSAMEIRARQNQAYIDLSPEDRVLLPPNFYFTGTVNVDETTHGFADKVYDRAQLIEMGVDLADLKSYLGEAEFSETVLKIWEIVQPLAPFAFRVLNEIMVYIKQGEQIGLAWKDALDEQILQKVLPKLKGTDPRLGNILDELEKQTKDELPLTYSKVHRMAGDYRTHGFTSYF